MKIVSKFNSRRCDVRSCTLTLIGTDLIAEATHATISKRGTPHLKPQLNALLRVQAGLAGRFGHQNALGDLVPLIFFLRCTLTLRFCFLHLHLHLNHLVNIYESAMANHSIHLKRPKGRELLGGDLLAQCLHQLGVRTIFGLHGGHLDAFLMGCSDADIELIDTRHETVAVQAAEGYAKVSGNTGCCFVTANSG